MAKRDKRNGALTNKQQNAMHRWNRVCLWMVLVLAVSAIAGQSGGMPDLQGPDAHGFPYWFLLCCAYPALEILSLINIVFGSHNSVIVTVLTRERTVIALTVVNVICVIAVWYFVRGYLFRKFGTFALKVAFNLMLMLLCWGVMQLVLFGMYTLWQGGGFKVLHESRAMSSRASAKPDYVEKKSMNEVEAVPPAAEKSRPAETVSE